MYAPRKNPARTSALDSTGAVLPAATKCASKDQTSPGSRHDSTDDEYGKVADPHSCREQCQTKQERWHAGTEQLNVGQPPQGDLRHRSCGEGRKSYRAGYDVRVNVQRPGQEARDERVEDSVDSEGSDRRRRRGEEVTPSVLRDGHPLRAPC